MKDEYMRVPLDAIDEDRHMSRQTFSCDEEELFAIYQQKKAESKVSITPQPTVRTRRAIMPAPTAAPSRKGRKPVQAYVSPELHMKLRTVAIHIGKSVDTCVTEAVEMWLEKASK